MPEIVTDVDALHKSSETIGDIDFGDTIEQLTSSIPAQALGLSAPQIGIHKRVFIVNLSSGSYAFMNPDIVWVSPDKITSQEGCLSLPGISRCVSRHAQIDISCAKIVDIKNGEITAEPDSMRFKGKDAFIIQHENDHLDGKLITDHEEAVSHDQRYYQSQKARTEKIQTARLKKKQKPKVVVRLPKLNSKRAAKAKLQAKKNKRAERTRRRAEKISVETQERYKAEKENLFADEKIPSIESKPIENQE